MRIVILPTPGDPVLLHYWLAMAKKYWLGEVDKVLVHLNTPAEEYIVNYIMNLFSGDKFTVLYTPFHIQHGDAIDAFLDDIDIDDIVMLMEDDAFVFRKGAIAEQFRVIEEGRADIVGSKRGSCSMEILKEAERKWGLDYTGHGDQGCNFWPCFFWTKNSTLLDTDRDFNSKMWRAGDLVEPLGWTPYTDVVGDTFVNTSLQLHAKGYSIEYVPQWHASPDDLDHHSKGENIFSGRAPWTHIGSLSSGFSGVLVDEQGIPLAKKLIEAPRGGPQVPDYCKTDGEKREWERRVQMWLMAFNLKDPNRPETIDKMYEYALNNLINQYKLSRANINKRIQVYKEIGFI